MQTIKIINQSDNPLPKYATSGASGMDLHAHLGAPVTIAPSEGALIPTGLYIELSPGCEAQIRARSSWGIKGLIVPNAPGTIDADYRGEIKVALFNISKQAHTVNPGDRMAQLIVMQFVKIQWAAVNTLNNTERGTGGFGSTDKQ